MKLTIDFETRSCSALKQEGPWKYAEDSSTEVLCLAVKIDDKPTQLWAPEWVRDRAGDIGADFITDTELVDRVNAAETIEAHNVEFERAIWTHVMPRYGIDIPLPIDKCCCTAARAARLALPRDLATVCKVLGCDATKDDAGHRMMLKMCKPRAARKAEKEADPDWEKKVFWHEEPEHFQVLLHYCIRDVEAEHDLSKKLPDLPDKELLIWKMDQECNERGVRIDLKAVANILRFYERHRRKLNKRLKALTDGFVTSGSQIDRMHEWMKARGVIMPSLAKDDVEDALKRPDLPESCRQLLKLRQSLAKTSTRKYNAMVRRASVDERARALLMYHGASTGRWTAKAIQIQNLPRGSFRDTYLCIDYLLNEEDWDIVEDWWGDPMEVASSCLRGMLIPASGHDFISADFSAIEGRVLAWLAGEEPVLQNYRAGLDPYKVNASRTYGVEYVEVAKDQRQVGKVQELALGYAGGIGSFASMGKNYGLDSNDIAAMLPELLKVSTHEQVLASREWVTTWMKRHKDTKLSFDAALAADLAKVHWRRSRPKTVLYWNDLEEAAIAAVRNPGLHYAVRGVVFRVKRDFLCCTLPSQRVLYYCKPHLRMTETPWGAMKATLHYWGIDSERHKWCIQHTYGGKLAENITQAVARDLLRDAMLRMDSTVYTLAFHVHDEIVVEVPEGQGDVESFCSTMAEVPFWAESLPVEADGWRGKRYRKD